MWNYVLLLCLLRQHKCELFHAMFSSLLSIAPVYLTMSVHSITFLVYQPFQLEGVMAVSVGVKTRSSEKIVLPVDADRTTVVLAQEPAPSHITHTHADLDKELATPLLTPTPADRHPVPVDTAPSPPQSTQTRAVSKATAVPKSRGPPLRTRSQRLKQKKNCSQVRFRSYGSYYFALASLYLLIPTNFKFEGCNWNSNGATGMF